MHVPAEDTCKDYQTSALDNHSIPLLLRPNFSLFFVLTRRSGRLPDLSIKTTPKAVIGIYRRLIRITMTKKKQSEANFRVSM